MKPNYNLAFPPLLYLACVVIFSSSVWAEIANAEPPAPAIEEESDMLVHNIDKSKWVFPSHGAQKSQRADQVFLAFPHNRKIFVLGSVITLGWQPITDSGLDLSHYEIFIANSQGLPNIIARTGSADKDSTTTYLFTPLKAGRYFWSIHAVTTGDLMIPSVGRYINIIE